VASPTVKTTELRWLRTSGWFGVLLLENTLQAVPIGFQDGEPRRAALQTNQELGEYQKAGKIDISEFADMDHHLRSEFRLSVRRALWAIHNPRPGVGEGTSPRIVWLFTIAHFRRMPLFVVAVVVSRLHSEAVRTCMRRGKCTGTWHALARFSVIGRIN
jgi:hypothetical protein